MEYPNLNTLSYNDLKDIAKDMELTIRRSKNDIMKDISYALKEYEKYKKHKLDKYVRLKEIGYGKEGTTFLVETRKGNKYAMKTFKKLKSSKNLQKEAELQIMASNLGISPYVKDIDTVSKYIVMEKMDTHLFDIIKEKRYVTKEQQKNIIKIYKQLDKANVFHGDINLQNYMYKKDKLYIIDFGMAREITDGLKRKLGTDTPNLHMMSLGLAIKLRDLGFPLSSYDYIVKQISEDQRIQFGF